MGAVAVAVGLGYCTAYSSYRQLTLGSQVAVQPDPDAGVDDQVVGGAALGNAVGVALHLASQPQSQRTANQALTIISGFLHSFEPSLALQGG
ncbi:hypothetical protein HaLaN_13795 [Haematococcus lacustris]|uniref:Uncharacterized protein n=1 Tax=Haematococcus lacustris TaxID=44745 RepID=A0A699Z3N4_HAELA|nr:hypothetical protein HaLaN_13795 [Haematococcus lacustris]